MLFRALAPALVLVLSHSGWALTQAPRRGLPQALCLNISGLPKDVGRGRMSA